MKRFGTAADQSDRCICRGTITVFLTLSLTVITSLISACISSAVDRSMRERIETSMDLALLSVFGEYNKKLLEEFDLYFIDCGYGSENGSSYYTGEHLRDYLDYNLNPQKGLVLSFSRDMKKLKVTDVNIAMESLATDSDGRVFKRQAITYIKDKYGVSVIENLKKNEKDYKQYGIEEFDAEKARKKAEKKLKKAENLKDEDGNKIKFKSPVKVIEKTRSTALESLLGELDISGKALDGVELVSDRELKTGCGIVANDENLDSLSSELLFITYLNDKFSCYTAPKNREGLSYEIEYVLCGKDSDKENLEETVAKIFVAREAANCIYAKDNEKMKTEAEAVAKVTAALLDCKDLEEPLKETILYAWAFAESCIDVHTLLKGGRVPLVKDETTWTLKTLPQALAYKTHFDDAPKDVFGLDYKNYLMLFLTLEGNNKKMSRSMDMIECDMRCINGNENFRMDNCIEFLEATAVIKGGKRDHYDISRYFGYMKVPRRNFN